METAVEEPEAPVEATVELPVSGETTEFTGTGQELSEDVIANLPAPPPAEPQPDPEVTRVVECVLQENPEACS